ncbi:MAG: triose-phosphate isomerase [Candidatus Aenigmarchaeota archaeon]|nr:triose-phosphate isomerase [Candidatus Aenigmarchaeota archaeon]
MKDALVLLINLKTYDEGTGANALKLAKAAFSLGKEKVEIIFAAQATDIRMLSKETHIPIFAQHVDSVKFGSSTGWILPEAVKSAGASGTLLNHSERRIDFETAKRSLARCRELGLRVVMCAESPEKAQELASLRPDYIAIEPPELIGGDISVSKAKPEVITESVQKVHAVAHVPVLCGAGVKDGEDVRKALALGAKGILVASGVVKAKNPVEAIKNLLVGFE